MVNIFKIIIIFICTAMLSSCASTKLASFGTGQSSAFLLEEDESRFWKRSDEEQERLDNSGHIYEEAALESYINDVLSRIVPDNIEACGLQIKSRIIKDPRLNAFCFPDGTMYLHTGIIARMDNEAQLAVLLGHEITHAINRHSIKFFRDVKNKSAFYNTLSVTASGVGGVYGQAASLLGAFGTLAAIYGYSKDNEREADKNGFNMVLAAGYDIKEAPKLFRHLQKNFDKEKKDEPFFFGTHPRLKERIVSYESLIQEIVSDGKYSQQERICNKDEYLKMTHELVLNNALLDISMGRFETAKAGIKKYLKYEPDSSKGYYYLGEVYMHQFEQPENKKLKDKETKEDKKRKAVECYNKAIELDIVFAYPYKALGLMYFKDGRKEKARKKLSRYLELNPDTSDSLYVKKYLEKL
ncbi:MAG: M48 family metalloprotease [Candidatus Omnitrophota bacterium]